MDSRLAAYIAALDRPTNSAAGQPARGSVKSSATSASMVRGPLVRRGSLLMAAHGTYVALTFAAWASIGAGALSGRIDRGWVAAWALCLVSAEVFRLAATWLEGVLAVGLAGALRQRLLAGAMATDSDRVQHHGTAELLAQVMEADSIDRLAVGGGLMTVLSIVELAIACVTLSWGAAPGVEIPLLVAWIAVVGWTGARNTRLRRSWTEIRLGQSEQLVEQMIAHRTRAVQQPHREWHVHEDRGLEHYLRRSQPLDRSTSFFEAVLPRLYTLAAIVALAPTALSGGAPIAAQAVTLGVVLYAGRSLRSLTFGATRAAQAWIAWRMVKSIADANRNRESDLEVTFPPRAQTVLLARDVTFAHAGRREPVVRNCALEMKHDDFVLLEGAPAGGKSTFASLLAGRRRPSSGAIMSCGLDIQTVGTSKWRRQIAAVPQYQENHVLSASFAFNLLLGRPLPHSSADFAEARQICVELGLGPLLDRMPSGLDQMIGETGWQLSHGERSRLFLARALLQGPKVVVLDETLAALDPENLRQSLECLFRRADSALVIAHP